MVHKSSIIPGLSKFIDENILSHYPVTSMKRIIMAGAVSLYLKQGEQLVDSIINTPLVSTLGVAQQNGMVDLSPIKDALKSEINKAGFMRISVPMVGDIDFTADDVDALYKFITEANTSVSTGTITPPQTISLNNGGVY